MVVDFAMVQLSDHVSSMMHYKEGQHIMVVMCCVLHSTMSMSMSTVSPCFRCDCFTCRLREIQQWIRCWIVNLGLKV
jgi:hypothetical protein